MSPVHCGSTAGRMRDIQSALFSRRRGRILTEVVLIVLIPCLCLGACCLCDSDLRKSLLSKPSGVPPRLAYPIMDAVRIDQDRALTVQTQGQMRLWSFNQSAQLAETQSYITDVDCVAYSAEQRLLAVGSMSGQLEIWDLDRADPPKVADAPDLGCVSECQFTPDGRTLLTADQLGQIILWDSRTLARRGTWQSPTPVEQYRSLAVSSDGKLVLAGTSTATVQVWDLEKGQHLRSHAVMVPLRDHNASINSVTFLSGDREFIAASANEGVGIWNVETGACVRQFEGVFTALKGGAFSADGRRFTAGTLDGQVVTWDTVTGDRIGAVRQFPTTVKCLLYSADGSSLLTGDWHGEVQFHRD